MTPDTDAEQLAIRCAIVRGGSSKGVFLHAEDLPPPGPLRDRLLKRIMGTPDPLQIDGLGGGRLISSKLAIIGPASVAGADLDYTFAQVQVGPDLIDYEGNCGNILAGVGPFAIDAGLVRGVAEPVTEVRIHNTNTRRIITARVPVRGRRARVDGDFHVAGVPGSGAPIEMDFSDTAGAKTGSLLPTGHASEELLLAGGTGIELSVCDFANTVVFVRASSVGLNGSEPPSAIDASAAIGRALREIRGRVAVRLGFATSWQEADAQSPLLPMVALISRPRAGGRAGAPASQDGEADVCARLYFMNRMHETMSGTAACCLAAASRIPGSVVHRQLDERALARTELRIGHPGGVMAVNVERQPVPEGAPIRFARVTLTRTARKLMDGVLYVPRCDLEGLA